jgi:hypothetical protein
LQPVQRGPCPGAQFGGVLEVGPAQPVRLDVFPDPREPEDVWSGAAPAKNKRRQAAQEKKNGKRGNPGFPLHPFLEEADRALPGGPGGNRRQQH